MIEALYASFFLIAGGVIIAVELHKRQRRISGILLSLAIVAAGVSAAVDSVYSLPVLIVYGIIGFTIIITAASVYIAFNKNPTS